MASYGAFVIASGSHVLMSQAPDFVWNELLRVCLFLLKKGPSAHKAWRNMAWLLCVSKKKHGVTAVCILQLEGHPSGIGSSNQGYRKWANWANLAKFFVVEVFFRGASIRHPMQ
jgi:hypothetical protein